MVKYTKEQLIFYIKDFKKKNKRNPTIKDFNIDKKLPSSSTYSNRFGSWNKSLKEAGLNINKGIYLKKELLDSLKQLNKELGRLPKAKDLKKKKWIASYSTYKKNFGSWDNALIKSGLKRKSKLPSLKGFLKKK